MLTTHSTIQPSLTIALPKCMVRVYKPVGSLMCLVRVLQHTSLDVDLSRLLCLTNGGRCLWQVSFVTEKLTPHC